MLRRRRLVRGQETEIAGDSPGLGGGAQGGGRQLLLAGRALHVDGTQGGVSWLRDDPATVTATGVR